MREPVDRTVQGEVSVLEHKARKLYDRACFAAVLGDLGAGQRRKWPRSAVGLGLVLGEIMRRDGWDELRIAELTGNLMISDYFRARDALRRRFGRAGEAAAIAAAGVSGEDQSPDELYARMHHGHTQ